jgi:hypothetical protein
MYFVTWFGDDDVGGLMDEEIEIFGQFLDRSGAEFGPNDVRLSESSDVGSYAQYPVLAAGIDEFLVVWMGPQARGQRIDTNLTIFIDGFESGTTSAWSALVP